MWQLTSRIDEGTDRVLIWFYRITSNATERPDQAKDERDTKSALKMGFILGLKYAVRKFPRGLLTGSCPLSWTSASTPSTPSAKAKRPQSTNSNRYEAPVGQSLASTTRPIPGPVVTFDLREQFSGNDLDELNTQLDKNLLPTDNPSRLSRSQTASSKQSSRASIASERSTLSNVSDKPWKP